MWLFSAAKRLVPLLDAQAPFKPFRFGRHGYSDEVPHFEIERRNLGFLRWS